MCRWLAYSGPPMFLDSLVFKPQNSLISQSLHALQGNTVTTATASASAGTAKETSQASFATCARPGTTRTCAT